MLIFRRLAFAILFLLATIYSAEAANRFWKVPGVTGAIVSAASPPQVRLTVASTTGMTTGDVRVVSGIVGTTEANGTWTITVIDGTHVDLQGTTFANLYTSGGIIYGKWDSTNTNNWVTTTGGTNYGQTVPVSADDVFFDANSGGNTVTVTVNTNPTINSMTMGNFDGTLDFSANNNSPTMTAFTPSGTHTRTLNMGNGTWTINSSGSTASTPWDNTTVTGFTLNANSSTLVINNSGTGSRTFAGGAKTYNILSLGASSGVFQISGGNTFAQFLVAAPQQLLFPGANTIQTITTAPTWTGTAATPILVNNTSPTAGATITVTSGTMTVTWGAIWRMTFNGGATFTGTNSLDMGGNTGMTITPPQATGSGGGSLIGG